MTNLIVTSSFKRAFKAIIKRQPNLKPKIEAKLRLLADNPYSNSISHEVQRDPPKSPLLRGTLRFKSVPHKFNKRYIILYYALINSKVNYQVLGLVRLNMIVVLFSTLNKIQTP